MDDRLCDGAVGSGRDEDTDELLDADPNDSSSVFGPEPSKLDHCDLLLDAIDAHLGQLQVKTVSREHDSASFRLSQSLSKDTGFGSTSPTNDTPTSYLDVLQTPTVDRTSERSSDSCDGSTALEQTKHKSGKTSSNRERADSCQEQVLWRLERLLGATCREEATAGEPLPASDSICTEDFVRCFREEMVELPEERSVSASASDAQRGRWIVDAGVTAAYDKSRRDTDKPLAHGERKQTGIAVETRQRGQSVKEPHTPSDDCSIAGSSECEITKHNKRSPEARRLAGVPVQSFDNVSIDSDLDSVCTEQVRQHIRRRSGWRAFILHDGDVDDCDTHTENKTQSSPVQRPSDRSRRSPSRKVQRSQRETYRLISDEESDGRKLDLDWLRMKEHLSLLGQKCEKEEETLRLKKSHVTEVELTLSELQLRRKKALQDLERLTAETAHMEREKRRLECTLLDSKAERGSVSGRLQRHRDQVRGQEEKLMGLSQQRSQSCMERSNVVVTVLEREEMERQLDNAKAELFSEQRRTREKIESMQEKLEEAREELHQVREAESSLRSRCCCLEEKQRQKMQRTEALESQARELQAELGDCRIRVGTLEKMLAQRELQLQESQGQSRALQAEKDGLQGELQHLKTQHQGALTQAEEQARAGTEEALKRQREDLVLAYKEQIQKLKEEEAKTLSRSLELQREELQAAALEKVHKSLEEERMKWEAEKVEAVQLHCGILEEQQRRSLESSRSETQRERSKALALQHKVDELRRRMQELEWQSGAQQKEQEALLSVVCKSLKEDHQAELQRANSHMAQESQRKLLQLQQSVERSRQEADGLQLKLEEKESSFDEAAAAWEQQLRHWAKELQAECEHLNLIVEQSGPKQHPQSLPPGSCTITEALTNLRAMKEQLKQLIKHLQQELSSQKEKSEQLSLEKERELSLQRQHLRNERDQALEALKERLIQEHVEELSSLNWAHVCDGGSEGRRVEASLRRQLKAKDAELRQVQRNMGRWKEQTAARLACKFEEELTAELERKTFMSQEERQDTSDGGMRLSAKETHHSVDSPCSHAMGLHPVTPSDVASLKLLRFLQSRVTQLRLENQSCSPSPLNTAPLDVSGSSLTTTTHQGSL